MLRIVEPNKTEEGRELASLLKTVRAKGETAIVRTVAHLQELPAHVVYALMNRHQNPIRRHTVSLRNENEVQEAQSRFRLFKRHNGNKDGSTGGFVENTAKVAESYIGRNAAILENSTVERSMLLGKALVMGRSRITDSFLSGNAVVNGAELVHSVITDHVVLDGNVRAIESYIRLNTAVSGSRSMLYVGMPSSITA